MSAHMQNTVTIYVNLPEEGSPTMRPTQALDMGNGLFKLLPTADYDPEDEVWEFSPGSLVRADKRTDDNGEYLYAIKCY